MLSCTSILVCLEGLQSLSRLLQIYSFHKYLLNTDCGTNSLVTPHHPQAGSYTLEGPWMTREEMQLYQVKKIGQNPDIKSQTSFPHPLALFAIPLRLSGFQPQAKNEKETQVSTYLNHHNISKHRGWKLEAQSIAQTDRASQSGTHSESEVQRQYDPPG